MSRPPWTRVAVAYVGFFLNSGLLTSYTLFILPIEATLGQNPFLSSSVFSLLLLAQAVSAPSIGTRLPQLGPRRVYAAGALLAAAGFLAASQAGDYTVLLVCFAVAGIGLSALGSVTGTPVATSAYPERRGAILGLLTTGAGVAALVVSPAAAVLIQALGWRTAYVVLAVGIAVLIIPASLVILPPRIPDLSQREKAPPFRVDAMAVALILAFSLTAFGSYGAWVPLGPYFHALSVPFEAAAALITMAGVASGIGRLSMGLLTDRLGHLRTGLGGYTASAMGSGLLSLLAPHAAITVFIVATLIFGISFGGRTPVYASLASGHYGRAFPRVWGWLILGQGVGGALGPACSGWLVQAYGSYHPVYVMTMGAFLTAATLFAMADRMRRAGHGQNERGGGMPA